MTTEKIYNGIEMVDYRDHVSKLKPNVVQIGSFDGVLGEEYGLQQFLESVGTFSLILVEPIPHYFSNLTNIYGKYGDMVSYCNHAISNIDGNTNMTDLGCCSFISPGSGIPVNSKTWNTFVSDMGISSIDLLLLDCEGYEFEIMKQIDYTKIKPTVIRYEYMHIPNKQECDDFLRSQGYRVEYCIHDHTYNKIAIAE